MKSHFANWGDLRVFLAVLRTGSTLAASKSLGMSQPTVARRIEALEHTLELTLFDRDTRGFRPTQAAERLALSAVSVEAAVEAFTAEAERTGRPNSQPIRITAPPVNFSANFAAILAEFRAAHPGTHFEFVSTYDVVDLASGEADVAIRMAHRITDERLICAKLTDVKRSLFASRAYAESNGLPASPDDLEGHSFVVYDSSYRSTINDWLLDRIDKAQIVSYASDPGSMIAALKAGLGIGPMTLSLAADHDDLVCCFDPPEGTSLPSWLVIGPDAYRRPEVRAFAAFFAPRFRAIFKPTR